MKVPEGRWARADPKGVEDLLDDGVAAVGSVRGDGVRPLFGDGGEECMEPPDVEQGCLLGSAGGLRSGMRRTTRRLGTCCDAFADAKAVDGISATSARDIQTPVSSSRMATGDSTVVHASTGIDVMARCTSVFWRRVTLTFALPFTAAGTVGRP